MAFAIATIAWFTAANAGAATFNDDLFRRLQAYQYGSDPAVLTEVSQIVTEVTSHRAEAELQGQFSARLAGLLETSASYECKQFVCRQLALIGTAKQVPVLAKMLMDDQLSDMARYALGPMSDPSAGQALRAALTKTSGKTQIGIISTLGFRRDSQAADSLGKLLNSPDSGVFRAAAEALGRIGGNSAASLLKSALAQTSGANHLAAADAYLACAESFLAHGMNSSAAAIDNDLAGPSEPDRTRAGALRGLMAANEDAAVPLVLAWLHGESPVLKKTALGCIRLRRQPETTQRIAEELSKLTVGDEVLALEALADRQENAAVPAILAVTKSTDPQVRAAAWQALGKVGDASAAGPLVMAAANAATEGEKNAALGALRILHGAGVDDVIVKNLETAAGARAPLISVLADRVAVNAVPALLKAATDPDQSVAQAAFRSLGQLAGPQDLPAVVHLLPQAQENRVAGVAEDAVVAVARKIEVKNNQSNSILEALRDEKNVPARCSLLRVLGRIADDKALEALENALREGSETERDIAVRELSKWPDASAIAPLENIYQNTENKTHRVLALRGYLRLLAAAEDRPVSEKMKRYREVLNRVRSADEKKLVLAGLAEVNDLAALNLVVPLLDDEPVRLEASQAALQIARVLYASNQDDVKHAMNRLLEVVADTERRQQAQAVLKQIDELGDYLVTWQAAGPYFQRGKDYQTLFDIEFPPERPDNAQVTWRAVPAGADPKQPWLIDLLKLLGGEQRVAYLRTSIYSDKPQEARLELGSDDGIKVWLNGQLVHANNVARPLTPNSDRVTITLRQGWNLVLLKITQNNQGWACCARLRKLDGSRIEGLRTSAERID